MANAYSQVLDAGLAIVEHGHVIGKFRQQRVIGPERPPVGAEMKTPVGVAEAV